MELFQKEQLYLPYIKVASAKYNVPQALILGHMKQESAFNPNAYRAEPQIKDGSTGLMQVLLNTAKTMDTTATQQKLFDPAYNIDIGTKYIAKNLARYDGNVKDAIAAYNAGSAYKNANGRYVSANGKIDVQGYVDKVYTNTLSYNDWLQGGEKAIQFSYWDILIPIGIAGIVFYFIWRYNKKEKNNDEDHNT
jgi:soluble lytic murein transglycosylase-like protein